MKTDDDSNRAYLLKQLGKLKLNGRGDRVYQIKLWSDEGNTNTLNVSAKELERIVEVLVGLPDRGKRT